MRSFGFNLVIWYSKFRSMTARANLICSIIQRTEHIWLNAKNSFTTREEKTTTTAAVESNSKMSTIAHFAYPCYLESLVVSFC